MVGPGVVKIMRFVAALLFFIFAFAANADSHLKSGSDAAANGPVLFFGKPVSNAATRLFPSLGACLDHDAATLNWSGIADFASLDVCLFRMVASLGPPDHVQRWMASEGFALETEFYAALSGHKYGRSGSGILTHSYRWDTAKQGLLFDRAAAQPNQSPASVIAITVFINWADNSDLVSLSHSIQGRWTK